MRQFSGKDCKVAMLGRETALISITYGAKQEKRDVFVLGQPSAVAEVVGRKIFEGEIVMIQSEFEAMVRSLPEGQDILDIAPFDILVLYLDETTNLAVVDVLKNCSFREYSKSMKNEDDMMEVSLPIRIGSIQLGLRQN
jgi:hypothetical protein